MNRTLLLAWRYLAYHRARTAILVLSVVLVFLLPVSVHLLVDRHSRQMAARADATPLLCGAQGSRYDLVLNALYFRGRVPNPLSMAEADALRDSGLATPLPLLVRHRARGRPVVGTTHDYYGFRGLRVREGAFPQLLGDAVLGAAAAEELGLASGDTLLTEAGNVYDLSLAYPLRMRIVGVLHETGTPDDAAVFVDLKTAWLIEGIGHGHGAPRPREVLAKDGRNVALNASVTEYTEVTPENIGRFHVHAAPEELPLTAVIAVPFDGRAATKLKGRYRVSKAAQLLVPSDVVAEILGFVFRVKRLFDANVVLVSVATALLLALIVLLTLRVRRREMETLFRIGCARATTFRLMAAELVLTVGAGLVIAGVLAIILQYRITP